MKLTFLLNSICLIISLSFIILFFTVAAPLHIKKQYTEYTHQTLYIDREFLDSEKETIFIATTEWCEATNGKVSYTIVYLPSFDDIDLSNGIIINKISEDNIEVIKLDLTNQKGTLGYYSPESSNIGLITKRLGPTYFKSVVLHELGRALGLNHNDTDAGINTLMYPSVDLGADHITPTDIKNYCIIHHCKLQH